MVKGLVLGKFEPFSVGHESLIDFARNNCDYLYVLLCMNDKFETIPGNIRLNWLLNKYGREKNIKVIYTDKKLPYTSESNRLISHLWAMHIKELVPDLNIIFTSEDYGDYVAEFLGIQHICFDKQRIKVPISGTIIRNNPVKYWDYISDIAKPHFVKKICICGTESTGKSILTEKLSRHFNTIYVQEWGRTIVKKSEETTIDNIIEIGKIHATDIIGKTYCANKILFSDTDLNTTKVYSKFFFNEIPIFDKWVEDANKFDLHIFLNSDAPYVNDGERLPKDKRDVLGEYHYDYLKNIGAKMEIVNGTDWDERTKKAVDIINKYFFSY